MDFVQQARLVAGPAGVTRVPARFTVGGTRYSAVLAAQAGAPGDLLEVQQQAAAQPAGAPARHYLRLDATSYVGPVALPALDDAGAALAWLGPPGLRVLACGAPQPAPWSLVAGPPPPLAPPASTVNLSAPPAGPLYLGLPGAAAWLQPAAGARALTLGPAGAAAPLRVVFAAPAAAQAALNLLTTPGAGAFPAFPSAVSAYQLTGGGAALLQGVDFATAQAAQLLTVFRTDGGTLAAAHLSPAAAPGARIFCPAGDVPPAADGQLALMYDPALLGPGAGGWLLLGTGAAPGPPAPPAPLPDGTAAAPALAFAAEPGLGLYRDVSGAAAQLGLVAPGPAPGAPPAVGLSVGPAGPALGLGPAAGLLPTVRVDGGVAAAFPQAGGLCAASPAPPWPPAQSPGWPAPADALANRAAAGFAAARLPVWASSDATAVAPGARGVAPLDGGNAEQVFARELAGSADGYTLAVSAPGALGELYVLQVLATDADGYGWLPFLATAYHAVLPGPAVGGVCPLVSADGRVVAAGQDGGAAAPPLLLVRQPDGTYAAAAPVVTAGARPAGGLGGHQPQPQPQPQTAGMLRPRGISAAGQAVLLVDTYATPAVSVLESADAAGQWAAAVQTVLVATAVPLLAAALSPDGTHAVLLYQNDDATALLVWFQRRALGDWAQLATEYYPYNPDPLLQVLGHHGTLTRRWARTPRSCTSCRPATGASGSRGTRPTRCWSGAAWPGSPRARPPRPRSWSPPTSWGPAPRPARRRCRRAPTAGGSR